MKGEYLSNLVPFEDRGVIGIVQKQLGDVLFPGE